MYSSIPPARFLFGVVIVSLPAAVLKDDEWSWRYVALILVMYLVFNWRGLQRFAAFARSELRQ